MIYALDTEAEYSKELSITVQGAWHYIRATNHYLLTIVGEDGFEWAGHPSEAPWEKLHGHEWCVHNYGYDGLVFDYLEEIGHKPKDVQPSREFCTSDYAAWRGVPRSLAGACEWLLGEKVSKETRDQMKGKTWASMTDEFKAQVIEYALNDSRKCLKLRQHAGDDWPDWERKLSELTRKMSKRGIAVDTAKVDQYLEWLKQLEWHATRDIPWASEGPALSAKRLAEECRKVNILPPPCLDSTDPQVEAWEEQHGKTYPWLFAMATKRRSNTLKKKLEVLRSRIQPNGRFSASLKYCGASGTKRWSGDSGFNLQNQSREPLLKEELEHYGIAKEGVDIRSCFVGNLGISDLNAIEPRCAGVIVGNREFIEKCAAGHSPYQARAIAYHGFTGKDLKTENPDLAALCKVEELSLQYGVGWWKLLSTANIFRVPLHMFEKPLPDGATEAFVEYLNYLKDKKYLRLYEQGSDIEKLRYTNAWLIVKQYRDNSPLVTRTWKRLGKLIEQSVGGDMIIALPSGNRIVYRELRQDIEGYSYLACKNGRMIRTRIYPSLAFENLIQHCARDVFAHGLLQLDEAGKQLILQVHDEAVVELQEGDTMEEIEQLLCRRPAWMPSLPLKAGSKVTTRYCK